MSEVRLLGTGNAKALLFWLHIAITALLALMLCVQPVVRAFARDQPPATYQGAPTTGQTDQTRQALPAWYVPQPSDRGASTAIGGDSATMVPHDGRPGGVDSAFQLEVLANFYATVIGFLIILLTLIAGFAFWTIKVVSRAQAEESALQAAQSVLGGHDGFRQKLGEVVRAAVADEMENVYDALESYAVGSNEKVVNPSHHGGVEPGKKTKPRRRRVPVNGAGLQE